MPRRFIREDWLNLGLSLLSAEGPDALKLTRVTAEAGLTKGSFYHHFQDLASYLKGVAEQWREVNTESFIRDVDVDALDEAEFERLIENSMALDVTLELRIRELAKREPEIAELVADTDQRRLAFAARVYQWRFAVDAQTAKDLALLDYGAFAGIVLLKPDISLEDRARLYELFNELLRARFFAQR